MFRGGKTKRMRVDDRHERALGIGDNAVTAVNDAKWNVQGTELYEVVQIADLCPQRSCKEWNQCFADGCAGLCIHMFTCECPDADKGWLCKHVHKVRMWSRRAALTPAELQAEAKEDERWKGVVHVERKVREVRGYLRGIQWTLNEYEDEENALTGIIDEVAEELGSIAAKISSHCDEFGNGEGEEEEEEGEHDDDDEEEEN